MDTGYGIRDTGYGIRDYFKPFLIVGLSILLFSGQGFAGPVSTGWTKITFISNGINFDRINIIVSENVPDPASCNYVNTKSGQISENTVNKEGIYTLVLAAFMADKDIKLTISDTECSNGRPNIVSVQVQ